MAHTDQTDHGLSQTLFFFVLLEIKLMAMIIGQNWSHQKQGCKLKSLTDKRQFKSQIDQDDDDFQSSFDHNMISPARIRISLPTGGHKMSR